MSAANQASPVRRGRATRTEIRARREALYTIVAEMRPRTVRQVFYQATVRGMAEKAEAGYTKIQTDLVLVRRSGALPYGWLADNTRWQRKPATYSSIEEALEETARLYRKVLWAEAGAYVENWLEKDALARDDGGGGAMTEAERITRELRGRCHAGCDFRTIAAVYFAGAAS